MHNVKFYELHVTKSQNTFILLHVHVPLPLAKKTCKTTRELNEKISTS